MIIKHADKGKEIDLGEDRKVSGVKDFTKNSIWMDGGYKYP